MTIRTRPTTRAYETRWDLVWGNKPPVDLPEVDLEFPEGCILGAYRGSVAHGMYVPKNDPNHIDDVDIIGVVVPDPKFFLGLSEWGTRGTKEEWHGHYDCVWYEIRKAFRLLLMGNPNIMSLLWLRREHYLQLGWAGEEILDNRHLFVGKHVYDSFAGYASAQLQKMELRDPAELREYIAVTNELKYRGEHPNHKGEIILLPYALYASNEPKWIKENDKIIQEHAGNEAVNARHTSTEKLLARMKRYQKKGENLGYLGDKRKQLVLQHGYDAKNAAHCIRLLRMAKEFLATGEMEVFRTRDRSELLDIKAGKWSIEEIHKHAKELFAEVKAARDASTLPEGPDREGAERLLVEIVREAVA